MRHNLRRLLPLVLMALCFLAPLMKCYFKLRECGGIHSPYYFVGYDTGFGGRKLLGTIFGFILPEYVHHRHLVPFILAAFILVAVIFAVHSYLCLRNSYRTETGIALTAILAVYLISPYSILVMIPDLAWYADVWLYLAALLFLLVYRYGRRQWWYFPLTAVICVASCLTHHVFCCMFFPMFVVLFIHDTCQGGHIDLRRGAAYTVIGLLLFCTFVLIWLGGNDKMDIDAVYTDVCRRTNCVCSHNIVFFQWLYGTNSDNIRAMWEIGQFPLRWYQLLPVLLLLSPLIALFLTPWIMAVKHAQKGLQRTKYLLMLLLPNLLILPLFAVATDYSRWLYAWAFCQTMLLLTLHADGDTHISQQILRLYTFLRRHWPLALLLLIYICSFQSAECGIDWIEDAPSLFRR